MRCQRYYTKWDVMVRHWPELKLPEASPSLLKRKERQGAILSVMTGPSWPRPLVGWLRGREGCIIPVQSRLIPEAVPHPAENDSENE